MNQIRRLDFSYQALDSELMADVKKSWIALEEQRKDFKLKIKKNSLNPITSGLESTLLLEIQAMERSANLFEQETSGFFLKRFYFAFFKWLIPKTLRTRSLEFNVRCMNLARHMIFQEEYIRHLEGKLTQHSEVKKEEKK